MFSVCTLLDGMVRMAPSRARHACRKEGLRPSVRLMRRHWRQHLQRCVFLQETLQIQAQARSQALLGARLRGGMDRDLGGDGWEGDDFGGGNSGAQALHLVPVRFKTKRC